MKINDILSTKKSVKYSMNIFGILLCLIGIIDSGSSVGFFLTYVIKFLFGKLFFVIFSAILIILLIDLLKKKEYKVHPTTKVTLALTCVFLLICLSSFTTATHYFDGLFVRYVNGFNAIKNAKFFIALGSSSKIGGGIIGYFLFAILASIIGDTATFILSISLASIFAVLTIIPLVKIIKEYAMNRKIVKKEEIKEPLVNDVEDEEFDINKLDSSKFDSFTMKQDNDRVFTSEDKFSDEFVYDFKEGDLEAIIEPTKTVDHFTDPTDFDVTRDNIFENTNIIVDKVKVLPKTNFDPLRDSLDFEDQVLSRNNYVQEKVETVQSVMTGSEYLSSQINHDEEQEEVFEEETYEDNSYNDYNEQSSREDDEIQTENNFYNKVEEETNEYADQYEENQDASYEEQQVQVKPSTVVSHEVPQTPHKKINWKLPPSSILNNPVFQDTSENELIAQQNALKINSKLSSLNIKGKVVDYLVSPSFTRFRIEFAPEYRIKNFNNVDQDMQAALEASSISILTPIPGDKYCGIDVPNKVRSKVTFKECFNHLPFQQLDSKLLTAVGKDCLGHIVSLDIYKSLHLLVAGTTGSGKSGGLNAIICSLIMRATPNEVRLLLVDPKLNEFKFYNGIPHLICPVIYDNSEANEALKRMCQEITRRNEIIQSCSEAIDITSFNAYQEKCGGEKFPFIVIVLDEFAYMMKDYKSDVENSIKSITAIGRSVGVYIICATQTPRSEVVTGEIKANLPSIIAFTCKNFTESNIILGGSGAEKLLSRGDMIMDINGVSSWNRVQGCFVEMDEKNRIVNYWKEQGAPEYYPEFTNLKPLVPEQIAFKELDIPDDANDQLYTEILEWLKNQDAVSISALQRHFGIGQPRAGRMIDMLEKDGYISPPSGFKSRSVYKNKLPGNENYRG